MGSREGLASSTRGALMGLIAGVVVRPVTVTMVTVALLLFGLVAVTRMPVELLPDLSYPSITVQTTFADAAPAEIEELVTRPVEELVGGVPGVVAVESASREGSSEVVLDFAWGTRIDDAMADVREKLDRVRLPTTAERPVVLRYDPSQEPIMRLALVPGSGTGADAGPLLASDFRALRDVADKQVKQDLEKLDGVAAVQLHGGDEEEVVVELDPERLAAYGIDASEVVTAIGSDNVNRPGGGLTDNNNRYLIRTVHEAKTAEDLGAIIIRQSSSTSSTSSGSGVGGELRLRDLATRIERTAVEREELSLVGGAGTREVIELAVYREGDANTVRVAETVQARLTSLERSLPPGHELIVLSNQARFIDAAIVEVALNTLVGGGLAILVLLFFLRDLRSTLVIGVAIPISLLVSFVPLTILGVSLNLMSLGGLALGVGMLVDNSIVTLEAIAREREGDPAMPRAQAAICGTVEIASSVVASTLTTVAVFFPMAFVEGVAGQLVRDLAYAVSFSILSSMLVSLTLVPVLQALGEDAEIDAEASEADEGQREASGRSKRSLLAYLTAIPALLWVPTRALVAGLGWLFEKLAWPLTRGWELLEDQYPKLLRGALRVRSLVLLAALGLCVGVTWSGRDLGRTLLPEVRQGEVYVQIELPQGTSLERTAALTRGIVDELSADPRAELIFARVGSVTQGGSATGSQAGTHLAQINLKVPEALVAEGDLEAIEAELFDAALSAANTRLDGLEHRLRLGRPELLAFDAPIEVRVYAEDSQFAIAHARRLLPRLREVEGLEDVAADDLSGRPEVRVAFDRERLGLAGLDVERAAAAVQRAIQGEVAGQLHAPDKQLDIRVRLPEVDRSSVEDVARIQVGLVTPATTTGTSASPRPVLLTAVAAVEPTVGPAEIRRIDGRRGLRIRARAGVGDLGALASEVQTVLDEEADALARSGSGVGRSDWIQAEVAGQANEMGDSLQSLAFTALLSIFLVYVVMASSFESLHHPFLIMFTVPLAIIGVVLACQLTGTPISAMVGIGAIILGGIVVNNAIVLINAVNQRRGRGMGVDEALIEAGSVRARPIAMTTATTVLGLMPMAIGMGEGAALRQPLALAVIGGLLAATALTLVVIPCAYALVPGKRRAAWD